MQLTYGNFFAFKQLFDHDSFACIAELSLPHNNTAQLTAFSYAQPNT